MIAAPRPAGVVVSARTFARLKWRLLTNGFRRGGGQAVGTALSAIASVVGGLSLGALGVGSRWFKVADQRVLFTMFAAGFALVSLLVPLVAGGIDETLPVALLRPFPLKRSQLLRGLLLAGCIGPAPMGGLLILIGALVGSVRTVVGGVLSLVAGLLLLTSMIVGARVLPTVFARAMNSRRGRDAAVAVASLAGLSGLISQLIGKYLANGGNSRIRAVANFARWSPPGALGRAMVEGGRGNIGSALGGIALGAVGLAALSAVWMWALTRLEQQSPSNDAPAAKRVAGSPLFSPRLGWLPRTPVGAIAARQIRYTMREPKRRVAMIMSLALGIVFPIVNNSGKGAAASVLFGASASWLLVLSGNNQLGTDGRALWFDLSSGASTQTLMKGRNLGLLIFAFPIVAAASITLAALTNGWAYLPAALLVGSAAALGGLGAASLASVIAPMRVSESSNPFASGSSGQGCVAPALGLLCSAAVGVLLSPVAIVLVLWRDYPARCFLVGVVALPYGALLWWLALRTAARRLVGREPELIALVDPR